MKDRVVFEQVNYKIKLNNFERTLKSFYKNLFIFLKAVTWL